MSNLERQNHTFPERSEKASNHTDKQKSGAVIKTVSLFFIMAACLFMSGCNGKELDTLAIVTSLEVTGAENTADNGSRCKVQAEIIKIEDSSEGKGSTSNAVSTAEGADFTECLKKLQETESRQLYLGHLRILIFDQNYLKSRNGSDMKTLADFAVQNSEIRFNTLILAADTSAGSVLEAETTATGNKGIDLSNEMRLGGGKNVKRVEIVDIINEMYYGSQSVSLPVIALQPMNDKTVAVIDQELRYKTPLKTSGQ